MPKAATGSVTTRTSLAAGFTQRPRESLEPVRWSDKDGTWAT